MRKDTFKKHESPEGAAYKILRIFMPSLQDYEMLGYGGDMGNGQFKTLNFDQLAADRCCVEMAMRPQQLVLLLVHPY